MSSALSPGVRDVRTPYDALPPRPAGKVRFTFDDLLAMREAGVFREGEHVELVDGEFVAMASEGTLHSYAVTMLIDWLTRHIHTDPAMDQAFVVSSHATLLFDAGNRREPDLMVLYWRPPVSPTGPADVALLFEAATTSADTDLNEKRLQYAAAGIAEYWVYETEPRRLTVFRAPQSGDYSSRAEFGPGQLVSPLFAPAAAFDCALLAG